MRSLRLSRNERFVVRYLLRFNTGMCLFSTEVTVVRRFRDKGRPMPARFFGVKEEKEERQKRFCCLTLAFDMDGKKAYRR